MGNVLLVHGICAGSTSWQLVAQPLRDRGHQVTAIDLHRGSLDADTSVAQEAVDAFGAAVVACGHSYGGMVITGLALPAGSHLVYLGALMPDETETALGLSQGHPADLGEVLTTDGDGNLVLGGEKLDEILWADATPDQAALARAQLRPQAVGPLLGSPTRIAWRDTPSTYVVTAQDRALLPDLQRDLARRATRVIEWDCSHTPMVASADLLVDLLDDLATT